MSLIKAVSDVSSGSCDRVNFPFSNEMFRADLHIHLNCTLLSAAQLSTTVQYYPLNADQSAVLSDMSEISRTTTAMLHFYLLLKTNSNYLLYVNFRKLIKI